MPAISCALFRTQGFAKFWIKSVLHYCAPTVFGYAQVTERTPDSEYVHERDKHPVRRKHTGSKGWKLEPDAEGMHRRDYASYEEYTTHQKQKLNEMLRMKGGFSRHEVFAFRRRFYSRFRHLSGLIPKDGTLLCLGARQGTEVEVLRDLGYSKAEGLDLNPGPGNPLVRTGDFMHLEEAASSVDFLYTNCADHAFDLDAFFSGHVRVLKPDGYAMYEFSVSEDARGAFEAVGWARVEDVVCKALRYFDQLIHAERDERWLWILLRGKCSHDIAVAKEPEAGFSAAKLEDSSFSSTAARG